MEEFLTVDEAATRLRFSEATVLHMLQTGELSGVMSGSCEWRVTETAVRSFLTGNNDNFPEPIEGQVDLQRNGDQE